MGYCLLWAVIQKLKKQPTYLGYFIPRLRLCIHFDKKLVGYSLSDFFKSSSGHPVANRRVLQINVSAAKMENAQQRFFLLGC
jgi:hypothetical protein